MLLFSYLIIVFLSLCTLVVPGKFIELAKANGYEKTIRPNVAGWNGTHAVHALNNYSAEADEVKIQLLVTSIKEIDEVDGTFLLMGLWRRVWKDPRLKRNRSTTCLPEALDLMYFREELW